jgi:hypothetical protein
MCLPRSADAHFCFWCCFRSEDCRQEVTQRVEMFQRDYRLDAGIGLACHADAVAHCNATDAKLPKQPGLVLRCLVQKVDLVAGESMGGWAGGWVGGRAGGKWVGESFAEQAGGCHRLALWAGTQAGSGRCAWTMISLPC